LREKIVSPKGNGGAGEQIRPREGGEEPKSLLTEKKKKKKTEEGKKKTVLATTQVCRKRVREADLVFLTFLPPNRGYEKHSEAKILKRGGGEKRDKVKRAGGQRKLVLRIRASLRSGGGKGEERKNVI